MLKLPNLISYNYSVSRFLYPPVFFIKILGKLFTSSFRYEAIQLSLKTCITF